MILLMPFLPVSQNRFLLFYYYYYSIIIRNRFLLIGFLKPVAKYFALKLNWDMLNQQKPFC